MKAAIFDVDGTLLDSMSVWEDIGERYLASQNITAEKNLRAALHTMSLEQGAAWMKEKYQLDKSISQIIEEVLKIVSDFYRFEAPLKPGVKKTLEWFKEKYTDDSCNIWKPGTDRSSTCEKRDSGLF